VYLCCLCSVSLAMEDSAKLRLVRCPKCQNVLHEQASYSVYQCGGCGAVLRGTLLFVFIYCLVCFFKKQNYGSRVSFSVCVPLFVFGF